MKVLSKLKKQNDVGGKGIFSFHQPLFAKKC